MKERKLPIFFFSLIFALLVWISVNLGNQFQTVVEVPVRIENLPPDRALAVPLPTHVRFTVQGTGWQLVNTLLSPNLHYLIDFQYLSRKDILYTSRELNERVNLSKDLLIFGTSPETVLVRLDEKLTKTVPIIPTVDAVFRDGFGIVGRINSSPDSIVLQGARSLLNRIDRWTTERIVLQDINAPVSVEMPLRDTLSFEVERNAATAHVTFDVQPIAEKTIDDVEVEIVQVPGNRNVVLIPPKISIIVRSGVNKIAGLTAKDFQAFIDYKSILLDTSGSIQPSITGPADIQIVLQNPGRIQYVVRK